MPSLRDHLIRTPEIRPRTLGTWIAPALGERATPMSPRILEEAALSVLAHIVGQSGPIREQLVGERRRFERLVHVIHRLPERGGDR
jgi:hypothetical protein